MRQIIPITSIVIMVLLAGCFLEPAGTPSAAFDGEVEVDASGEFRMEGSYGLSHSPAGGDFSDLSVCLYSETGSLVKEERLGSLNGRQEVSVSAQSVPDLVVFYSPDFDTESVWFAYYLIREDDSGLYYVERKASSSAELPVDPRGTGCGSS